MSIWNQLGFQDSLSMSMQELMSFHDFAMMVMIFTMSVVGYMLYGMMLSKGVYKGLVEGQYLEFIWTILPAIMLIMLAVPSLSILYSLDELSSPSISVKIMGHQWYWSYEFSEFWGKMSNHSLDCYMIPSEDMSLSMFRLLDTDSRPCFPFNVPVRALVSSSDVLHSWTIPSLGVKMDATPGRLNQTKFISRNPGVIYGQCSEICGANHSFMPISIELVNVSDFLGWIENM